MPHRFLPHTGDIRAEIVSPSLGELLADCLSLVRELVAGPAAVATSVRRPLALQATDAGDLVWQFGRTLLDWFNTESFVPARVEVQSVGSQGLVAAVLGEPFDPLRHPAQPEVKALTRHAFEVRHDADGWHAEMVFDV